MLRQPHLRDRKTYEVDTGELLESLKQATSEETLADSALEAVEVGGLGDAHLVAVIGLDLGELIDDCRVLNMKTAKFAKRRNGLDTG